MPDSDHDPIVPADAEDDGLLAAAPGLARLGAGAWLRTAEWTLGAYARAGSRVLAAAVSGESAGELLRSAGDETRHQVRRLLGIEESVREAVPDRFMPTSLRTGDRASRSAAGAAPAAEPPNAPSLSTLRERGEALLALSTDVAYDEEVHPAYARILGELAPDEARILRLFALEGAQAAVDVRTGGPLGVLHGGSQMIAPGLNMIGAQAGCRFVERVSAYLNNLFRLGLIWFSREPLEDPLAYQVLEAQPEVNDALRQAGRGRTVRRSIALTPFGADFCRTCLPLGTAEFEALPAVAVSAGSDS